MFYYFLVIIFNIYFSHLIFVFKKKFGSQIIGNKGEYITPYKLFYTRNSIRINWLIAMEMYVALQLTIYLMTIINFFSIIHSIDWICRTYVNHLVCLSVKYSPLYILLWMKEILTVSIQINCNLTILIYLFFNLFSFSMVWKFLSELYNLLKILNRILCLN